MRTALLTLSLLVTVTLTAQTQRGIFAEDIDKTADACTSFFDYANGAWRKANPIPASMSRWSRRWAAGEQNKEQLKIILDAAAKTNGPKGSIDQLTGDFYASCMDEARIDRLGVEPLK